MNVKALITMLGLLALPVASFATPVQPTKTTMMKKEVKSQKAVKRSGRKTTKKVVRKTTRKTRLSRRTALKPVSRTAKQTRK